MWTLAFLLAYMLGFCSAVHAIMSTRTAQGSIAWAVSLITFPFIAVPAYWVFGRSKFYGYVIARRGGLAAVEPIARQFLQNLAERNLIGQPERDRPLLVEQLAKLPFTRGNDAELLVDGQSTFRSIFEGISKAEVYVLVQFYIIRDDDLGCELKRLLIERARAGIRCYLLYDEIGSRLPRAYCTELIEAGVP